MRGVRLSLVLAVASACGCNFDVTLDPENQGTGLELQSEQSIVRTVFPDGRRGLVMGFIDSTGQLTTGSDGRPAYVPGYSQMGLALSADNGTSWLRLDQFDPPPGLTALQADPWLATTSDGTEVWYVFLGVVGNQSPVDGTGQVHAIAYTHSISGGLSWSPVDFVDLGYPVDKCSVAVSEDGQDIYIAYVHDRLVPIGLDAEIEVLVSNDGGGNWDVRTVPGRLTGERRQNPIVRIVPGQEGVSYVSFQTSRQGFRFIDIARSTDSGGSYSTPTTVVGPVGPLAQLDGAGGRAVRNLVWQHFAVQPGVQRLVLGYEDAGRIFVTTSPDGSSWGPTTQVAPNRDGRQFQVSIAASRSRIGALFYEQPPLSGASTVVVAASSANGSSWVTYEVTSTPPAGSVPFEPCPSGDGSRPGYFGDYVGVAPLALVTDNPAPAGFYGAWADSRLGCLETDRFRAVHQHTVGAPFL